MRPVWNRPELKQNARNAMNNFYWKAVIASLIVAILGGGFDSDWIVDSSININLNTDTFNSSINILGWEQVMGWSALMSLISVLMAIIVILSLLYLIFIASPLDIGHKRFYLESRFYPTEIGRIFSGFTGGSYGNVVKTMFTYNMYIFLYSLLLIIPGIIKSLEYSMVPYILAENPNIETYRALELSKQMTEGRKWQIFLFGLSFLGWRILAGLVIIGNIALEPYIQCSHAELYLWLRYDALQYGYSDSRELPGLFMDPPEYNMY